MQYSLQVSTTENKSNYRVFVGIKLDRMSENTVIRYTIDVCVERVFTILFALHANNIFFSLFLISNKAVIY